MRSNYEESAAAALPMGEGRPRRSPYEPAIQARNYCLECQNGSGRDVSRCCATFCPLYFMRYGMDPRSNTSWLTKKEREAFFQTYDA